MLNISKVETLIKEKGWSKPYFCSLFNKSRTWIADWKRGRGLPDENMLHVIADRLDTTADYITDKTEQKNKPAAERDELNNFLKDPEMKDIYNMLIQLSPDGVQKVKEFAHFQHEQEKKQKP